MIRCYCKTDSFRFWWRQFFEVSEFSLGSRFCNTTNERATTRLKEKHTNNNSKLTAIFTEPEYVMRSGGESRQVLNDFLLVRRFDTLVTRLVTCMFSGSFSILPCRSYSKSANLSSLVRQDREVCCFQPTDR